ncbi:glycerophosphodiester phosphodiesterase [Eremococcus coleocola]|uniref:glycerophosphodiester phosphodiesterase n=1 Tax=Eremococcus coleocola TaxID=88132 RepID=UPI00042167DE|nr:glycerophosphodiester phosphodiesterase [Eremococcus coleocola]
MIQEIIAHRGYTGKYPENTRLAFEKAAELPIWGIELDVHLSKDQEVVIIHDEAIDRTSNGSGLVKDMTLEELRSYQFYGAFPELENQADDGLTIMTLDEFLAWMQPLSIKVNIELKTNIFAYEGIVQKVIDLIKHYNLADRVLISSFNHRSIRECMTLAGDLPLEYGFLTGASLLEPGDYCKAKGVGHYHPFYGSLVPADIINCHQHGIQINAYTINDKAAMKAMVDLGLDRLITNFPEDALEMLQ